MASGPAQTQLADPSFFQFMDPSLSQPLYRNREGLLVGPLWSKGAPMKDLTRSAINQSTAITLTAAQLLGGFINIVQASGGALVVNLPSSSDLQQALSGYADSLVGVGNSDGSPGSGPVRVLEFTIYNSSTGSNTLTVTAGTGTPTQTVIGSPTIAITSSATYWIIGQRDSTGAASLTIMRK